MNSKHKREKIRKTNRIFYEFEIRKTHFNLIKTSSIKENEEEEKKERKGEGKRKEEGGGRGGFNFVSYMLHVLWPCLLFCFILFSD